VHLPSGFPDSILNLSCPAILQWELHPQGFLRETERSEKAPFLLRTGLDKQRAGAVGKGKPQIPAPEPEGAVGHEDKRSGVGQQMRSFCSKTGW